MLDWLTRHAARELAGRNIEITTSKEIHPTALLAARLLTLVQREVRFGNSFAMASQRPVNLDAIHTAARQKIGTSICARMQYSARRDGLEVCYPLKLQVQ